MRGLHCCSGSSLVVASGGRSLAAVCGLLIAVASLAEHRLYSAQTSAVEAHRLSGTACGILVPRPRIEPVPPAEEVRGPYHWTTREVPPFVLNNKIQ